VDANEYFRLRQLEERQKYTREKLAEEKRTAKCPDASAYDLQARLSAADRRLERLPQPNAPQDAASARIMPEWNR
jgi:hypothetical protein